METLAEYDEVVKNLTPFQKRVLDTIDKFPNSMANTWEVAWNGFAKEWNEKRSAHGALFRCILQAGQTMQSKGVIVILSPRDQLDTYTFCSQRKWLVVREQQRAQHSAHPTRGSVAQKVSSKSKGSAKPARG